ncbi:microsomal triacylglycerol transfer protein [Anopheles ziemanni]|uniref:microsomal triacylglycerol transfer protein n=1 Tax=Anopheles coustani TaxID=139045 RepID=UPI0026587904|nr:microsomal triacylglycerol transfer protein [Anopheles coustani]XP_058177719.1 microsomal triacylglycerol transfer protein [Anopheles ziemanni]
MWLLLFGLLSLFELRSLAPAFDETFQVGTEQQFSLSNKLQVGAANNDSKQVGYHFQAVITVGAVWGTQDSRLLMIQVKNPAVSSLPDTKPGSVEGIETPFYAWWQLGRINAVYFTESDSVLVRNSKKAIGALFQFQLLDGTYLEEDPSGLCKVTYTSRSSTRYHKSKESCQFNSNRIQRTEYPLQSKVKISRNTDFTVSTEGCLQTVLSREFAKYVLNAFDNFGAHYDSTIEMKAIGISRNTVVLQGSSIEEVLKDLYLDSDTLQIQNYRSACTGDQCESTVAFFKKYQKSLTDGDIGTGKSSTTLIELVQAARQATVEELLRILKAKTSQPLKGQLLDILGAAQTVASHEAAKTEFRVASNEEDTSLAERYLQALAIATRPQKKIIEDLLQLAQNEPKNVKLADSLIQCLSSVTQRYAQVEAHGYDSELVRKVTTFIMERIQGCTKDGCKLRYIRGLHNLKNPVTAHMLLKLVQEAPRSISVAAMKGLKSFSVHLWNDEFKSSFDAILFQVFRPYDSSARALAFDILLDMKPNYFELMHLMQLLKSNDKSFEVKQYMLQKLRMLAEQCREFAVLLQKVIEGDPTLNNYHVLVPKGLSTALSRQFSEPPTFNASISSLQEMSGGVLKRGIVDLTLNVNDEKTSIFTLGLFAGGLSSFVSSDAEESNDVEEEETMAGMELSIQGTVMRPLVFFSGKGELMGHVWSGTASERTPAYQATTLLQDNEEWFHSQSGATLRLSATGAISIDLNGQVTMSLWGRNAQSKVEQNTGITMTGSLSAETAFASIAVNFSTVQEPQLHLTSALDFSSDPVLCMQLVQPKNTMKVQFYKTVFLVGWKQSTVYKKTKLYNFNGLTHVLNRKNNEMCNLIS